MRTGRAAPSAALFDAIPGLSEKLFYKKGAYEKFFPNQKNVQLIPMIIDSAK
jgi:hypothetical protein